MILELLTFLSDVSIYVNMEHSQSLLFKSFSCEAEARGLPEPRSVGRPAQITQ